MANKFGGRMKSMLSARIGKIIFSVVCVFIIGGIAFGVNLWYQNYKYVDTNNASISAPLIPVGALTPCQIISLDVDYGTYVEKGQSIAIVGMPRSDNPANMQGLKDIPIGRTNIESPVNGYIAAVWTYPGAVVSQGQPIVTVYDISETWVIANITETEVYRIKPGQEVEINVDSLGGAKLKGHVEGIAAATAATFSLLPQNNTTANFIKVAQVVPVKIAIEDPGNHLLIPGTSAEVKIAISSLNK
jgi:multidrug resistance efflux pump